MDTGEISIFVIVFGFLAVFLIISLVNYRTRRAAWQELASQVGLNYEPGNLWGKYPAVRGVFHGRSLVLDAFARHVGNERVTYTRIALNVNNASELRLTISNEGVGSKLKKMLGGKEILVGDEAIDAQYYIQGSPEMAVQRLLSSTSLRQKLLESKSLNIELNRKQIVYQKRGFEANPEKLLNLFDLMGEIASTIERLE
jgi:hypothetical protein